MSSSFRYTLAESLLIAPLQTSLAARWTLLTYIQKSACSGQEQLFLPALNTSEATHYEELIRLKIFEKRLSMTEKKPLYGMSDICWKKIEFSLDLRKYLDQTNFPSQQGNMEDFLIDDLIRYFLSPRFGTNLNSSNQRTSVVGREASKKTRGAKSISAIMTYSLRFVLVVLLIYCDKCGIVTINTTQIKKMTGLSLSAINLALTELRNSGFIRQTVNGFARQEIFLSVGATHVVNLSHEAWGEFSIFGSFWVILYEEPRKVDIAKILDFCDDNLEKAEYKKNNGTQGFKNDFSPINFIQSSYSTDVSLKKIARVIGNDQKALSFLKKPLEQKRLRGLDNTAALVMLQTRIELASTYLLNHKSTILDLSFCKLLQDSAVNALLLSEEARAHHRLTSELLFLIHLKSMFFASLSALCHKDFFSILGRSSVLPQNRLNRTALVFYTRKKLSLSKSDQLCLITVKEYEEKNEEGSTGGKKIVERKKVIDREIRDLACQDFESQVSWGLLTAPVILKKFKSRAQTKTKN